MYMFFAICCRPEIDNDVISGQTVDIIGVDVPIKFGDSRSNHSRDIRLPNDNDDDPNAGVLRSSHKGKMPLAFCLTRTSALMW